jgi:hypothetical protein
MALVGLVRVSTSKQETQRQHDDLYPICVKVFEEKASSRSPTARTYRPRWTTCGLATCSPSRKPTGSAATSWKA